MTARILVVDDNPLNIKLLAAKLTHDYYVVTTAEDGQIALDKMAAEKPDIVLLDVMMPKLDGFETCRRIKKNPETAHIPVVMVTALTDVADRVKGLEAGADDFLTKPINDIALMARVRSLLRLKMVMDEWRSRESTNNQFVETPTTDSSVNLITGGHVVLLEDSASDREIIINTFGKMNVRVTFAATIAEAENYASTTDCDLVMVSIDLQDEDGLRLCPQLRTKDVTRQTPILLIANENETARVARGLDVGANDYLIRPIDANELTARSRTQLRQKRQYQLMRRAYERNLELALVDPLTGAFNRRYLDAHMPKLIDRCRANRKSLSVLMIDLDHFKSINDTLGHSGGDYVLKETVSRVLQSLRPSDLVARMGGEEFAVIMPETDNPFAFNVAERLRRRIGEIPFEHPDFKAPQTVTISIGVGSLSADDNNDAYSLFQRADRALYDAKTTGRNRVCGTREG